MGLTCAQAEAKLASITTAAELRQLLSELDISRSGQTTVLYRGKINGKRTQCSVMAGIYYYCRRLILNYYMLI